MKIFLHENFYYENFHTRKFPDLQYKAQYMYMYTRCRSTSMRLTCVILFNPRTALLTTPIKIKNILTNYMYYSQLLPKTYLKKNGATMNDTMFME